MSIIIEMSKNKMKQYFNSIELKEPIPYHTCTWFYVFPKNKKILKYWKYRKELVMEMFSQYSNEILCFDNEEQFKDNIFSKKPHNGVPIIFEFPDEMEDEAFYFQMKYC